MGQVGADHNYLNQHRPTLTNGSLSISAARAAPYHERLSHFTTRKFQATVLSQTVDVEVLKMNASLYIWVGSVSSDSLDNMCISMPSRFDAVPLASPWFGETDATLPVAQKLAQVLGKPVVLSLGVLDYRAVPHLEQAIVEDIRAHPDHY